MDTGKIHELAAALAEQGERVIAALDEFAQIADRLEKTADDDLCDSRNANLLVASAISTKARGLSQTHVGADSSCYFGDDGFRNDLRELVEAAKLLERSEAVRA